MWAVTGRFFQSLPVYLSQFLATWSLLAGGGSPKPKHGIFKDMIFKTWDFSFVWVSKTQTWKFFGHDFQDVGSSVFGDLEFALRVSKTQKDLGNFRIWFSGHGFQDLRSQLWGLDLKMWDLNFGTWFLGHGWGTRRLHSVRRSRAPTSLLWSQLTNLSPTNLHFKSTIVNCNEKNRGTGMFPSQQ